MTTSEQLYLIISNILMNFPLQNPEDEPKFAAYIQSRREEHHFGIQPIRDQNGSILDILQSPDGDGFGLHIQTFSFPDSYSIDLHLKEIISKILFPDPEDFLYDSQTQLGICTAAEIRQKICVYSAHLPDISDNWRKPLINRILPDDAPAVHLLTDDFWITEWYLAVCDHAIHLIHHYYTD